MFARTPRARRLSRLAAAPVLARTARSRRLRRVPAGAGLAALALAGCGGDGGAKQGDSRADRPDSRAEAPAARPVSLADAAEVHLRALARIGAEHGQTRAAGTPGYDASTEYVADRLRDAGYRVTLQAVPFPVFRERAQ